MKKKYFVAGLGILLLVYTALYYSNALKLFDYTVYDLSLKAAQSSQTNNKSYVTIVNIDEKSIKALGQWPWSRLILSQLIKSISRHYPTSISFDIIFPEKDKTSPKMIKDFYKRFLSMNIEIKGLSPVLQDNDKVFAYQISKTKTILPVYLSSSLKFDKDCYIPEKNRNIHFNLPTLPKANSILCNIPSLQRNAHMVGFMNIKTDEDGRLRRVPTFINYKGYAIPSLALASLLANSTISYKNGQFSILGHHFKTDAKSNILLNFGKKSKYSSVSAIDILQNRIKPQQIIGKNIIIGATAVGLHDNIMVSSGETFPGVFIHAAIIDNILQDSTIYQPSYEKYISLILSVLLSIIFTFLLYRKKYIKLLILFFASSLLYTIATVYFLKLGLYISLGYFLGTLVTFFIFINLFFIILYYYNKREFKKELNQAHFSAIESMALVVETRDSETGAHIKRTKIYMKIMAEYFYKKNMYQDILTTDFIEILYRATPLHDIGKVGIPDYILKKEGKLTKEEYIIMQEHPTIGNDIIKNAIKENENNLFLQVARNIAYYHHEKWDGTGYPTGLKGKDIPLEARMMALVDVYDALISKRCYKSALTFKESEDIIITGSGEHFDPEIVKAFVNLKDKFREIALKITDKK